MGRGRGCDNNLRISHANTQILQTAQAVRTLYATQNTVTAGDITSNIITAGSVPKDMVNGATLISPWGGKMWVAGTSDNVGFVTEMNQVPQAACINLVSTIGGVSRDPSLFQATAVTSTGAVIIPGATAAPLTTAITPTTGAAPVRAVMQPPQR